jgi:hypothetical protein
MEVVKEVIIKGYTMQLLRDSDEKLFSRLKEVGAMTSVQSEADFDSTIKPYMIGALRMHELMTNKNKVEYDYIPSSTPPPPQFPPVKVIRGEKHIGYETLDGKFIPLQTNSEVPTQWVMPVVFAVFFFLLGSLVGSNL